MPPLIGRIYSQSYFYNASGQVTNRNGQLSGSFLSSAVSPSANFIKGVKGELIASGQSYTISGLGTTASVLTPETYVIVLRLTASAAFPLNSLFRVRSYNVRYDGTFTAAFTDSGATLRTMITKTMAIGDLVAIGWSGGTAATRCAIYHEGVSQSAASNFVTGTSNTTTTGAIQINAGYNGTGPGVEFVAAFAFTGLLGEQQLQNLVAELFNQTTES
jgi:hypothetical protein